MAKIRLCKTRAGNGLKVVIDGVWYYTSNAEMTAMLNGERSACDFRSAETFKNRNVDVASEVATATAVAEIIAESE